MPLNEDIDNVLKPLLTSFEEVLRAAVEGELVNIYVSGTAEMTKWAGLPFEGPPAEAALAFAEERGAELVTLMDEETKRRVAAIIKDGIANKRGIPGLARDIRNTFADMTRFRSELIARTETANALGEAFMDRGKELGITGKEWVTAGDNRVSLECQDNEAAGVIPFNSTFPTGKMRPPEHPDCRCAAAPATLKGK